MALIKSQNDTDELLKSALDKLTEDEMRMLAYAVNKYAKAMIEVLEEDAEMPGIFYELVNIVGLVAQKINPKVQS